MAVNLAPGPYGTGGQFRDSNNIPLNGGLVYTYASGTTTPQPTFTTSLGTVQNANPIVMSTDGMLPQEVWLTAGIAYTFLVTSSTGTPIYPYSQNNITGINDFSAIPTGVEWTDTGLTPVFVNTTSFTLPGNQTGNFAAKRRIRLQETAGTVYGVVVSSSFLSPNTTVNVLIDSGGTVDSGISAAAYGILNSVNPSIPQYILASGGASVTYAAGIPTIAATILRDYIAGCTISNGTDTVNDINIAAGQCVDSTNAVIIVVATMAGKQLDAGWAVGANAGMRNSAIAIANTTYHIYAVATAAGVQDIYAHTSATVATVIAALQAEVGGSLYIYAREIAKIVRVGATILQFVQDGDLFQLVTPVADITSGAGPGTAAITRTLSSVPTGQNVIALLSMIYSVADNVSSGFMLITDLATADVAPSVSISDCSATITAAAGVTINGYNKNVRTNTSAQVRARVSYSSASVTYIINTLGWVDSRGRNN